MVIIDRIFSLMEQKNIKNIELANKLEVRKSVISSWKSRKTNPPAEYIDKIAELLGVSISYIITGKDEYSDLSADEIKLLEKYNVLTERNKGKIETFIDERIAEQESCYTNDKVKFQKYIG